MPKKSRKLVLFDIDGTLIRHFGKAADVNVGFRRFSYALNKVFGIHVISTLEQKYHGSVDREILYDIAQKHGISKDRFNDNFDEVKAAVIEYAHTKEITQIYEVIPDAVELLSLVRKYPERYFAGILTGNVDRMAKWKLTHVGIKPSWFSLFVTSDEFEDRISLAKSVFARVEKEAGLLVQPKDTFVIGDAVGDVRCAHAIEAHSIIVTTGIHTKSDLAAEHPTLLVDSLMDSRVLELLGLET